MQLRGPGHIESLHQASTRLLGSLAEGATGAQHFPPHTFGGVHGAEKEPDVHHAEGLDDGVEEGHLDGGLPLAAVAQEVGDHGLAVEQALAHGHSDGLADAPTATHPKLMTDRSDI